MYLFCRFSIKLEIGCKYAYVSPDGRAGSEGCDAGDGAGGDVASAAGGS